MLGQGMTPGRAKDKVIILPTYVESPAVQPKPVQPTTVARRTCVILPVIQCQSELYVLLLKSSENQFLSSVATFDLPVTPNIGEELLLTTLTLAVEAFQLCHQGFFSQAMRRWNENNEDLNWTFLPSVNQAEDWVLQFCLVDLSLKLPSLTLADEWTYFQLQNLEIRQSLDGPEELALPGSIDWTDIETNSQSLVCSSSLHWLPAKILTKLTMEDPFMSTSKFKHLNMELDHFLLEAFSLPSLRRLIQTRLIERRGIDTGCLLKVGLDDEEVQKYGTLERPTLRTPSNLRGLRSMKVLPRSIGTLASAFWQDVFDSEKDPQQESNNKRRT